MAKAAYKHAPTLEEAIAYKMSTDDKVISYALSAVDDLKTGRALSASEFRNALREKREKAQAKRERTPK